MQDIERAHGYCDGDVDTNFTRNRHLGSVVAERYSRRDTIMGGLRASTAAFLGTTLLAACDTDILDSNDLTGFVVNAGDSSSARAGSLVTLRGSIATGASTSVQWTQVSGPQVELTGADGNVATFVAPAVASSTPLVFRFQGTDANGTTSAQNTTVTVTPAQLAFQAVPKNLDDVVTVPAGYSVTVMTRVGDPIAAGVPAYANDGTDTNFAQRIGDHGDALYWFGLSASGARDDNSSARGLLVQNFENLNVQYLHPNGPTQPGGARPAAEAIKEIEAHGVGVVEYRDGGNRKWSWVQNSTFNRRITPNTPIVFNGPVRGSDLLKTAGDTTGTAGTGTINNCANGHTVWGTSLTCEENWAGYFRRSGDDAARTPRELTALRRYGVTSGTGNNAWSTAGADPVFRRWDARATGASAAADYRNEPNKFGWVLEIDPYDPTKAPRKRTALGRMGHEGCWPGAFVPGRKPAFYMGDDAVNEYLYKFVSATAWSAADAQATDRLAMGDKYLDAGTLYVAKFNADGSGQWLPLVHGSVPNRPAVGSDPEYVFASQADVLVNTRLAADAAGATPMDRPEWTAVNPVNGEVYLTLTNNSNRVTTADTPSSSQRKTDAANPRVYADPPSTSFGNRNGHIVRLRETGNTTEALTFTWDIFLFGADAIDADPVNVNLSSLTADNDFSSPDGLVFSRPQNAAGQLKPLLWIQTDDSALTDRSNCMMLAAMPGAVGDGGAKTITNTSKGGAEAVQATRVGAAATAATLKRFLVGPVECEITGVDSTPDGRTLFVGIQHPGEGGEANEPTSHWPQSQSGNKTGRPRSAVVAITRNDGGVIGL